jgi:hypothetical protein
LKVDEEEEGDGGVSDSSDMAVASLWVPERAGEAGGVVTGVAATRLGAGGAKGAAGKGEAARGLPRVAVVKGSLGEAGARGLGLDDVCLKVDEEEEGDGGVRDSSAMAVASVLSVWVPERAGEAGGVATGVAATRLGARGAKGSAGEGGRPSSGDGNCDVGGVDMGGSTTVEMSSDGDEEAIGRRIEESETEAKANEGGTALIWLNLASR